jgi:anti-sigma factor RsiW
MLCQQFENKVWNYIDGRLARRQIERFSAHLKGCSRCRKTLEKAGKLLKLLQAEQAPAPPAAYRDSFWPRLRERIMAREVTSRPRFVIRLNPLYYAGLGATVVALILWVSLRETPTPLFQVSRRAADDTADYVMAVPRRPVPARGPMVEYVSPRAGKRGREGATDIDYILTGTSGRCGTRFEV